MRERGTSASSVFSFGQINDLESYQSKLAMVMIAIILNNSLNKFAPIYVPVLKNVLRIAITMWKPVVK
jgi:hypothetical protein